MKSSFHAEAFGDAQCAEIVKTKIAPLHSFVSCFSLTLVFGTLYAMLCTTMGSSRMGYMVVAGLLLAAMIPLIASELSAIEAGLGLVVGACASYGVVHFVGETITYSGNRVIYALSTWVLGLYAVLLVGCGVLFLLKRKKSSH